jgi:transcriptional regulator with XRE-family HTH domain
MTTTEPRFRREAIRELMEREGLSVSAFARKAAVSRTLVSAWLSGYVVPQVATLGRLCRVFGESIDFFFELGGAADPTSGAD